MADDEVFAQVDVQRVVDVVGKRVLGGEPAAVVRGAVDPVALHPPTADAAPHAAAQRVRVLPAVRLVLGWRGGAPASPTCSSSWATGTKPDS